MMRKFLIIAATLLCMISQTSPAFCENETDPYTGELIEWSDDAADGECGAEDETYAVEGLEPPTMSSSEAAEAESIVQSMEETAVQYDTSQEGTVQIICDLPEDYPGYTIEAVIYDDNFKKTVLDCYAKNRYSAMAQLPAGHYMLGAIYVPNDVQNRYPLVTDCKNFDLSGSQQVVITAQLATNYKTSTPTITEETTPDVEVQKKTNTIRTAGLVISLVGIGFIGYIFVKKLIAKNRFE